MAESLGTVSKGEFTFEIEVIGDGAIVNLRRMSCGVNASGMMMSMHPSSHLLLT